jgi:hypothetical protein
MPLTAEQKVMLEANRTLMDERLAELRTEISEQLAAVEPDAQRVEIVSPKREIHNHFTANVPEIKVPAPDMSGVGEAIAAALDRMNLAILEQAKRTAEQSARIDRQTEALIALVKALSEKEPVTIPEWPEYPHPEPRPKKATVECEDGEIMTVTLE